MSSDSLEVHLDNAKQALRADPFQVTSAERMPTGPGLYAVWSKEEAWSEIGLGWRGPLTPLYVGKAEDSLRRREVDTHFAAGSSSASKTGSSTVRRSFAALLAPSLSFRAIPRNVKKPGHFSNYALRSDDDLRLTSWMHEHLLLSAWAKPAELAAPLRSLEALIIREWDPPINIQGAASSRAALKAARSVLSAQARSWTD
ncbi:GIY-YIG nuclease family protein [Curtobacterium flaccumfaciens]|uniref:GIY-YIG nuclease family protein n=1 Tax=Curtobacterium flaccumfaciens TaxID=2035 RepID=UPI0037BF8F9F